MTAPLDIWRRYIHAAIIVLRNNDCRRYSSSSHSYAIQIRRTSAENKYYWLKSCTEYIVKKRFIFQSLIIKRLSFSIYIDRKLKVWSACLDILPARSRSVIPTLLLSSFNQRAMSGRWAHLSPVLFSFRKTLCPISSNNSLAQSSTWRLVLP